MKYKLLKNIYHPFGNYKTGEIRTLTGWMNEFGVDWLSVFERMIHSNPEWFEEVS